MRKFNFLGFFTKEYEEIKKHIIRKKDDPYSVFVDSGECVFTKSIYFDNTLDFFIESKQKTLDIL